MDRMSNGKKFRVRFLICFLSIAMLMIGASTNWIYANPNESVSTKKPIEVSKKADWVDGTSAKDKGIAKVTLKVNAQDIETKVETPLKTKIVLVLDSSGSMSWNLKSGVTRIEALRDSAEKFIEKMFGIQNVEIALVSYSDSAYKVSDFTSSKDQNTLINKLKKINPNGGTNIQDGIRLGQTLLDAVSADNEIMVVLSDGEPTDSFQITKYTEAPTDYNYNNVVWPVIPTSFDYRKLAGQGTNYNINEYFAITLKDGMDKTDYYKPIVGLFSETVYGYQKIGKNDKFPVGSTVYAKNNHGYGTVGEAYKAKKAGTKIYSIGFATDDNSQAANVMKCVASNNNNYKDASKGNLNVAFDSISSQLVTEFAGHGAVVDDVMGSSDAKYSEYQFKVIKGDENYPVSFKTPEGVKGTAVEYGNDNTSLKWILGSDAIKAGEYELTYYVDMNIEDVKGDTGKDLLKVLTNNEAKLSYIDNQSVKKTITFEKPDLDVTHYTMEYYYSIDNGKTFQLKSEKTTTAGAILGCSSKTATEDMISHGNLDGYEFISDKTTYGTGDNENSEKLVITKNKENNLIKLYYSKYLATGKTNVEARKDFNGSLIHHTFRFNLMPSDSQGNLVEENDRGTYFADTDAAGKINFDSISFNQEDIGKTFYYRLNEMDDSTNRDYIIFSKDAYLVKIKVLDTNHNGELDFEKSYYKLGSNEMEELEGIPVFKNDYNRENASVQLEFTKDLDGSELKENQFTFTLNEVETDDDATVMSESEPIKTTNDGNGNVVFNMTYTEPGVHTYEVAEENGGQRVGNIIYDDMKTKVTVIVRDDDEGKLVAEVVYPEDRIFNNIYKDDDGIIKVNKKVTLDGVEKSSDAVFYVALFFDEARTNIASQVMEIKMNGESKASVLFENLKYGTYYIAETDVNGKVIGVADAEELGYLGIFDKSEITVDSESAVEVNLDNQLIVDNGDDDPENNNTDDPENNNTDDPENNNTDKGNKVDKVIKTDTVEAENNTAGPGTGDTSSLDLWLGLLAIATLLSIVAVTFKKGKHKH